MEISCSNIRDLPKPTFINWLTAEEDVVVEGVSVHCFRLDWQVEEELLDSWALHVRRHYIRDDELGGVTGYLGVSTADYLQGNVVPTSPQIRSGDLVEIIVSDLLQFVEGYEVPRYKQHGRKDKNFSEHGTDVIAYRMAGAPSEYNKSDELLAVEVKSRCSTTNLKGGIREAAKDSSKDKSRVGMTLDYYFRCSFNAGDFRTASEIKRFLVASEHPFFSSYAVGVVAGVVDAKSHLSDVCAEDLCIEANQAVFIVHGPKLMDLVNEVYSRCVR